MVDLWRFIFSSWWVYLGTVVIIALVGSLIYATAQVIWGKS